jgi:hypothetical protein
MGQIIGCNECNNIEIAWTDGVSLLCSKQISLTEYADSCISKQLHKQIHNSLMSLDSIDLRLQDLKA